MKLFDVMGEFYEADRYMIYDDYANLMLDCLTQDLFALAPLLRNAKVKKLIIKNGLIKIQLYTY